MFYQMEIYILLNKNILSNENIFLSNENIFLSNANIFLLNENNFYRILLHFGNHSLKDGYCCLITLQ